MLRLLFVTALACLTSSLAFAGNPFFAMDTIARGGPDVTPALLRELGYDGFGGKALDETMPPAIAAQGLKFFNGYHTLTLDPTAPAPDEKLQRWFTFMRGQQTALWLAIREVKRPDGSAFALSSPDADAFVVGQLRAIADAGSAHGVRVALYPHTGHWLHRFEDAVRVADRVNRPDVGVTFNLCHWLKVEGPEPDPLPLLRAALPRLMFVSINGADTGDTKAMAWNRLIQPLDSGNYDVGGFVRRLQALGYTGPVGFQGYGIKAPPREVLARSIAAWRRFNQTPSP